MRSLFDYLDKSTYLTVLICITVFFMFADQNLMAPNLSSIANDFGYDDHERDEKLGGEISLGFFLLGAPVALFVGYLADVTNRCILLGIVILMGESACLGTYWVTTFPQLFVCRVLTGISIGGATPVIFSLLADLYSEEYRVYMSTVVGVFMSLGVTCGQLLAGFIGPAYGWRLPFLVVAIPAMFCGLIVILTATEPIRGAQEKSMLQINLNNSRNYESIETTDQISTENDNHRLLSNNDINNSIKYSEEITWAKVYILFSTPSTIIIYLQGLPGCVPWGMIYTFMNDYLSSDRGFTVQQATLAILIFGIGGIVGAMIGGSLGQYLYSINKKYQIFMMGTTTGLSVLPILYLLNTNSGPTGSYYVMCAFMGIIVNMNGPNVRSVLQVRNHNSFLLKYDVM